MPLFVPVTGTQESNQEASKSCEVEPRQFPLLASPSQQAVKHGSGRQDLALAWRSSFIYGPHRRDALCWHKLQPLWPTPACTVAQKQRFWCSLSCIPLPNPITAVSTAPLILRSCGLNGFPQISFGSCFQAGEAKKIIPFLSEILCAMKTQQ